MSNEPGILPKPIPFGKYYLLERINVGGMAEVYKAKAFGVEGFERLLAVKKILSSIAEDESFIKMFIDEAKISGQLSHPNIAQIFDLGKVDGSYFIAMEYISGKDVKTIFERARRLGEKVDIPRVCYIVMKVCEGLAYAHQKHDSQGNPLNIVHRDVSPQNVLISYEGEVKIIDFGIAKATSKDNQTQVGILKGKFSYMSPEQVRGLHVDHRSDIFSLGILLYEMLTLERLFLGESDFDTLEKIRKVEMSPPSLYNPHIPKELEKIVLRALAKSPDDRFQSSHELAEALEQFMRNQGYYFTNKDLAGLMKSAFSADIEFENKKLEYYRGLDLEAPTSEEQARVEQPARADQGLEWGDEEMETQIFDRSSDEVESITDSQIVYAQQVDGPKDAAGVDDGDPTVEYNRWEVEQQLGAESSQAAEPSANADSAAVGAVGSASRPASGQHNSAHGESARPENDLDGDLAHDGGSVQAGRQALSTPDPVVADTEPLPGPRVTVQSQAPNASSDGIQWSVIAKVAGVVVVVGAAAIGMAVHFLAPSIKFDTQPKTVDIYVNGDKIHSGPTPFTYTASAGPARIRIASDGYRSYTKKQRLEYGHSYSFNQALQASASPASDAATGGLFVKTDPPGARIELDGTVRDQPSPLTIHDLRPGRYSLEIAREGFFTEKKTVEIGSDLAKIAVELRPRKVSLTIQSDPVHARYRLQDTATGGRVAHGRTPDTIDDLAGGKTYRVVVDKRGHHAWQKAFEPGADPEPMLKATLEVDRDSADDDSSSDEVASLADESRSDSDDDSKAGSAADDSAPAETKPATADRASHDGSRSEQTAGSDDDKEPAPKKPVGTGTLSIASNPAARVHIDGQDTGRYTPIIGFEIKAGNHKVRLVNQEFGLDKTVYVDLKAGEQEKVINK